MYLPPDGWVPCFPDVFSCESCRAPDKLLSIIQQFKVETDPRYQRDALTGATKCNIFAADVALAMSVMLPHWWMSKEESANDLFDWLPRQGKSFGWVPNDWATATSTAAGGCLAIAVWKNPSGASGHIAVLRPDGMIAQAGASNFESGPLLKGFGSLSPTFWGHP